MTNGLSGEIDVVDMMECVRMLVMTGRAPSYDKWCEEAAIYRRFEEDRRRNEALF